MIKNKRGRIGMSAWPETFDQCRDLCPQPGHGPWVKAFSPALDETELSLCTIAYYACAHSLATDLIFGADHLSLGAG